MTTDPQTLERDRRAAAVFAQVMDVPTVDRPAAIRAALLANVEQLAGVLERANGFLSDLTVDAAADHFARAVAAAPVG